jgi:hypothetical protein
MNKNYPRASALGNETFLMNSVKYMSQPCPANYIFWNSLPNSLETYFYCIARPPSRPQAVPPHALFLPLRHPWAALSPTLPHYPAPSPNLFLLCRASKLSASTPTYIHLLCLLLRSSPTCFAITPPCCALTPPCCALIPPCCTLYPCLLCPLPLSAVPPFTLCCAPYP